MDKQYAERCGYHTILEISEKTGACYDIVRKKLHRFKIKPVWTSGRVGDHRGPSDLYILKEYMDALERRKQLSNTVSARCSSVVDPTPTTPDDKLKPVGRILTQERAKSVKAPPKKFIKQDKTQKLPQDVLRNIGLLTKQNLKPLVIARRLGLDVADVENLLNI